MSKYDKKDFFAKKLLTNSDVCGILIKLTARAAARTLKIEQRKTRSTKNNSLIPKRSSVTTTQGKSNRAKAQTSKKLSQDGRF